MTDNEIIKALECCKEAKLNQDCLDLKCPFATEYGCNIDKEDLRNEALDLINRQKAEIERYLHSIKLLEKDVEELKKGFTAAADYFASEYDNQIKAEAIKEFAERLKKVGTKVEGHKGFEGVFVMANNIQIDNLVKEMTERKE